MPGICWLTQIYAMATISTCAGMPTWCSTLDTGNHSKYWVELGLGTVSSIKIILIQIIWILLMFKYLNHTEK